MADTPAITDPTLTALVERSKSADRAADEARAAVYAYIARCQQVPGAAVSATAGWPAFPDDPGLIGVHEAAGRACRDDDTIRHWCERHGIGRRYGGRWRVSVERLTRHIEMTQAA